MSESIPIFEHTTASGTITPALIPARGAFVRQTNLPSNWRTVRIALLYSLRGETDADAPTTESIAYSGNMLQQVQIGLSNGAGMPGVAGVRFVGVGQQANAVSCVSFNSTYGWHILGANTSDGSARLGGRVCDGSTVTMQGTSTATAVSGFATPTGTTSFCEGLMIEFDVTTAGSLAMRFAIARPLSPVDQGAVGRALEAAVLLTAGTQYATTGGWWGSGTGVGCTHLFVRLPYVNNRLVIHGYKVAQVG